MKLFEVIDDGIPQHQQLLHCFDNAWRALMAMEKAGESDGVKLVHAMVTNAEGRNFAHGWLEKGEIALDFARDADNPQEMNATKYREALQAKNVVEYEAIRAMLNGAKHGNYGPWESNLI